MSVWYPTTSAAQTPSDEEVAEATRLYEEGTAAYRAGNDQAAYDLLSRSLRVAYDHRTAFNLALVCEVLGRPAEALEALERLGDDATDQLTVEQLGQVAALRRDLEGAVATVEVRAGARGEIWVDDRSMGQLNAGDAVSSHVDPGTHRLALEEDDGSRVERSVSLAAGERATVTLLPPTPARAAMAVERRPGDEGAAPRARDDAVAPVDTEAPRGAPWLWIGLGVGAALIAVAVVVAALFLPIDVQEEPIVDDVFGVVDLSAGP